MNILAVNLGSYSVKFFEVLVGKDYFSLISFDERPIDKTTLPPDGLSSSSYQLHTVKQYLEQRDFKGQFILQLPNEYITSRYLTIPVTQRKKVEQTIPFQLDESIPFSLSDTHYAAVLKKKENTTIAVISATQLASFDKFYKEMISLGITPDILTSELSAIYAHVSMGNLKQPCAIVDIGHNTTKGYFIADNEVFSNHISYIAGRYIDEVMANTYQINEEEAVRYKHENCFFLTEGEYDSVNQEQMNFARLMKQAIDPLIQEYRCWNMGFSIKHKKKIEHLYLTGGSSNIKNIIPFLTQTLSTEIHPLKIHPEMKIPRGVRPLTQNENNTYSLCHMMAYSGTSDIHAANFLKGEYSNKFSENLPLHSMCFVGTRVLTLFLFALLVLGVEKTMLTGEVKKLDKKINRIIKGPSLEIPRKIQKSYQKKPDKVLSFLKKKNNFSKKEIDTLTSLGETDAISPLIALSKRLPSNKNVDMISFSNIKNNVKAVFKSSQEKYLIQMEKKLKKLPFQDMKIAFNKGVNILSISFKDK